MRKITIENGKIFVKRYGPCRTIETEYHASDVDGLVLWKCPKGFSRAIVLNIMELSK